MTKSLASVGAPVELDFMRALMLEIGASPGLRIWRQNCGEIPVRDRAGKVLRVFHPGPPVGASDISGIVQPEGWRLEIEVKSAVGKRSKAQIHWARFVVDSGGVYALVEYDADETLESNLAAACGQIQGAISERRGR